MYIITPDPWFRKWGNAALFTRWTPYTFTSKSFCQSAIVKCSCIPITPTPALLITTSSPPSVSIVACTPAFTLSSEVTSISTTDAPISLSSAAASLFFPSTPRMEAATSWPAFRSVSTVSLPKPPLDPVINTFIKFLLVIGVIIWLKTNPLSG